MEENFIAIQLIFAAKFVSQDLTIKAAPGLSGPTNKCGPLFKAVNFSGHSKRVEYYTSSLFLDG